MFDSAIPHRWPATPHAMRACMRPAAARLLPPLPTLLPALTPLHWRYTPSPPTLPACTCPAFSGSLVKAAACAAAPAPDPLLYATAIWSSFTSVLPTSPCHACLPCRPCALASFSHSHRRPLLFVVASRKHCPSRRQCHAGLASDCPISCVYLAIPANCLPGGPQAVGKTKGRQVAVSSHLGVPRLIALLCHNAAARLHACGECHM